MSSHIDHLVSLRRPVICPKCGGLGVIGGRHQLFDGSIDDDSAECPVCHGHLTITRAQANHFNHAFSERFRSWAPRPTGVNR